MVFKIENYEREIFEIIRLSSEEMGVPAYIVGGYVRDRFLGRPSTDLDVVCVGDGIELARTVAQKIKPVPKVAYFQRFGTAMIRYKNMEIEFVGARKESYSKDSRKPAVEKGTLADDQNRRDFTINALAVSLNEGDFGELLDSFHGMDDLKAGILRTPLDPDKTFDDDPLRMMRAVRFATQLGFCIEEKTLESIAKNKERIRIVSKERINIELEKIIMAPKPSIGFKLLFDLGLLEIIFPEMVKLQGVEIRNNIGHKDNFYHTLEVLDNVSEVSDNLWLRWAAIMHDIAKPQTKRFDDNVGWTFHGHEHLGGIMVARIFKKMKLPLDHKMKYVQKLVQLHLRPIALTGDDVSDSAVRRLLFEAGEDIDDLMILCNADITSKNQDKVSRFKENYELLVQKLKEVEEKDHLRNWQPPVSGSDIMKMFDLPPSQAVGKLKTAVREAILDGEIPNEYDAALIFLQEVAEEMKIGQITKS